MYFASVTYLGSSKNWLYSAVAMSQRNFPARDSLLTLSINPAPPRRRYLTLMKGYLLSKVPMMRPTIEPPVRVPYQITSPSFFAFSRDGEVCWAVATVDRVSATISVVAVTNHLRICNGGFIFLICNSRSSRVEMFNKRQVCLPLL